MRKEKNIKIKLLVFINKLKKKKILLSFIISFAVLFNIFSYTVYAKYVSSAIENISFKLEEPIIELEGEEIKTFDISTEKVKYSFKVKNYNNEEKINKVNMEYYIQIVSNRLDLFKINLYKENEKLELNNYKTELIQLNVKEKKEEQYSLEVSMNKQINENIDSNIQIKVYCKQKT